MLGHLHSCLECGSGVESKACRQPWVYPWTSSNMELVPQVNGVKMGCLGDGGKQERKNEEKVGSLLNPTYKGDFQQIRDLNTKCKTIKLTEETRCNLDG